MNKKKILAAGFAMVLGAALITGCGGSKSASQAEQEEKTADGKTEITFWYSGGKTAVKVLQDIVDDFNESQTNYHVSTVTQADYTETYEKLQAAVAGKRAPDMALLDVDKARYLYRKELVEDLTSYTEGDESFQQEDFLEVFYNQGKDGDGLFALPVYGTTQVLYYNTAAFEKAGIDPASIKTWEDLGDAAEEMSAGDGSFYGWEPMWGKDNLIDAAFCNGAEIFSEDGTEVLINSPEWVEVWESFRKWIHEDKTMRIHSGGQGWEYWYNTIDDVLQNKAGGYTGSSGDQADLDFDIVQAMEQPGWGENPSAPTASALQVVMMSSSSNKEKEGAYAFMKYFTQPEQQAYWSMETGYVPVRNSTVENAEYKAFTDKNPQALVPFRQSQHGSVLPEDPTGGKVYDALELAADKVEIEGISAQQALDEAQKTAQKALDNVKEK